LIGGIYGRTPRLKEKTQTADIESTIVVDKTGAGTLKNYKAVVFKQWERHLGYDEKCSNE